MYIILYIYVPEIVPIVLPTPYIMMIYYITQVVNVHILYCLHFGGR